MDMNQMNRQGCRPYNHTCGMNRTRPACSREMERGRMSCPREDCSCRMPGAPSKNGEMLAHLQHLPLAMAYVPCQEFAETFDLTYALQAGTIFPQLCKPFCGRRGGR